jgi:CO/xanthine dehydrogenase Mo-binding subunit
LTFSARSVVRTAPGVVVKSWDEDLALAYAPSQGKTHLISAAGAAILETASATEVPAQALLRLYGLGASAHESPAGEFAEVESHLRLTVEGLSQAGLLQVRT